MATSQDCFVSGKTDNVTQRASEGFVVISWNVLHMVHEFNYVYDMSPVINRYSIKEKWSNEKLRLNDIVKTLSEILIKHSAAECFICLQEVPGDLLPMLREMLDSHVGSILATKPLMHIQTYSRKPHIRGSQGGSLYADQNESLVTIHYDPHISTGKVTGLESAETCSLPNDKIGWTPCPIDAGKGALTVTTASGLSVVNVHVPYDNQAATLLLSNISWPENKHPFVLVGDMNRYSKTLMEMLAKINIGKPSLGLLFPINTEKATRVGMSSNGTLGKQWLDHFVVSAPLIDLVMPPVVVYDDIGDISDHYPILLQFKNE